MRWQDLQKKFKNDFKHIAATVTPKAGEVHIVGDIIDASQAWEYEWFEEPYTTVQTFEEQVDTALADESVERIMLIIHSPGGAYFHGVAMLDKLYEARDEKPVSGRIRGFCASAATVPLLACENVAISPAGTIIIHKVMSYIDARGYYNDDEIEALNEYTAKIQADIRRMSTSMSQLYAQFTDSTEDDMFEAMRVETYYIGQEAIDAGWANTLTNGGSKMNVEQNKMSLEEREAALAKREAAVEKARAEIAGKKRTGEITAKMEAALAKGKITPVESNGLSQLVLMSKDYDKANKVLDKMLEGKKEGSTLNVTGKGQDPKPKAESEASEYENFYLAQLGEGHSPADAHAAALEKFGPEAQEEYNNEWDDE